jgi:Asp/Glu/hydantoin racemase
VHAGVATGGRAFYGASVGILMLEAQFPRIPGDMGNALTWPFPVQFRVVPGASPQVVVNEQAAGLRAAFLQAASELVADGCDGITTSCGFLSLLQSDLAQHVGVPVATSSLMQVQMVNALLPPGKRCGIVTVNANSLTRVHLQAAKVPLDTPIGGIESGIELSRVLLGNETTLDVGKATHDVVDAARCLVAQHPDLGAIVLECTNMPPYAAAVRAAVNLPVYDIVSFITWFQAGLMPRRFD